MNDLTDDDLMRLFAGGEAAAFDGLFDRYHAQVYRYARAMLGPGGEAEDVLQETFLAVLESAGDYRGCGKFRPWLMQIVRHRCLRRVQAAGLREKVMPRRDGLEPPEPPSGGAGPADEAQAGEARERIEAAVGRLPPRQREALALFAMKELSYQEIAELMGVPLNTVKTLIRRGRIELAGLLADEHEESRG